MLCDAFCELGRLPARPSPIEPAIILRNSPQTSKKWLNRGLFGAFSLVQLNLNVNLQSAARFPVKKGDYDRCGLIMTIHGSDLRFAKAPFGSPDSIPVNL